MTALGQPWMAYPAPSAHVGHRADTDAWTRTKNKKLLRRWAREHGDMRRAGRLSRVKNDAHSRIKVFR